MQRIFEFQLVSVVLWSALAQFSIWKHCSYIAIHIHTPSQHWQFEFELIKFADMSRELLSGICSQKFICALELLIIPWHSKLDAYYVDWSENFSFSLGRNAQIYRRNNL